MLAASAIAGLGAVAGCGRSAPVDALSDLDGDPDIAGVSVTSPDAVVVTEPTTAEGTVAPTTTAPPQAQASYTVEPGDTLSVIAGRYDVTIQELADYNGIVDVNSISPGQQILIPPKPAEGETTTTAQP